MLQRIIFEEYFLRRQTLKQLSAKYDKSMPWIMKQRDKYIVECKVHNPRQANLIESETLKDYKYLKEELFYLLTLRTVSSKLAIVVWDKFPATR